MRRLTLLLLVIAAHNSAAAQLDARIRMGARVRVSTPDARVIGSVAEVRDDSIVVERGMGDTASIALSNVSELAVFARSKGDDAFAHTLGVIAAASAATLYLKWCFRAPEACRELEENHDDDSDDEDDDGPLSSFFATVTLGFGAIGVLLGQALTPPRWHIVDLPVRVAVAPLRDGIGVYISFPSPRFTGAVR